MDPDERLQRMAHEHADERARADLSSQGQRWFVIGEQFPPEDPVARFMAGLAMIGNDWTHAMQLLLHEDNEPGMSFLIYRQWAVMLHEASTFIADSKRRFPEIAAFLATVGDEGQALLDRIASWDQEGTDDYQPWRESVRNVTAHYPELHPQKFRHDQEELGNALRAAAERLSSVRWDNTQGFALRYEFAYEVVGAMLPQPQEMMSAVLAGGDVLARFVREAFTAYFKLHPMPAPALKPAP
jgi:hypothetical protein